MTAKWTANTYTISFNGNGNTGGSTANKTCTYGQNCTLTSNGFTRTGYIFEGWATSASGSVVYSNGATVKNLAKSGTYNLYAKWGVTMQTFSCSSLSKGSSRTLKDTRDGNTYTVAKLNDGKCWMTQNLRLVNYTLKSSDSNVSSNYTIPTSGSFSASYADAKVIDTGRSDYGVYYNYVAASAGTITSNNNTSEASYSVCSKGWRLPSQSEWASMLSAHGISNNASGSTIARSAPINLVYGGYHNAADNQTRLQGSYGYWWTSTAKSKNERYLPDIASDHINASYYYGRTHAFNVRCIAQ